MKSFEEVWSGIDQEKVAAAINPTAQLKDYDYEDAKLCVFAACEKWLCRDIDELAPKGIEQKFIFSDSEITTLGGVKGYLDLHGTLRGSTKEFAPYRSQKFVLDWKTVNSGLDVKWKDRQLSSWQWKIYAGMSGAGLFFYRGIRRPNKLGLDIETREVIIEVPAHNFDETREHLLSVLHSREALGKYDVWPRNMPEACYDYNRVCPYFEDCDGYTMPRALVPLTEKPLSYTRLKTFLQCPERYRRDLLVEDDGDGSPYAAFGSAVHAGLAEVYSQVFGLSNEGKKYGNDKENWKESN